MQFGNDFILRMTGASSYQLPRKKDDVDDVKFASVFGMIGEHNKFIDISRCRKISLSSFEKIKQCSSLLYLDVSYTIVDTYFLSILQQHCNRLRGIMLGGSQIVDYSPLALVDSLEIISLRNSAVVSLDWISGLFRLRSLDLGSTQVLSLYPLSGLTRLEELCIDECLHVESSESNLGLFSRLPSLQLLNSADSSLVSFGSLISSSCDFTVCIESNPRKIRFLQAIIDNDYTTAHWLIGSGQDINIRIGPWADALLLRSWKSRCKYSRISTPLVQPSFTNEQLRPTPLHISLLFNSLEIIRDLVESGADLKARCWYGEVKEDSFENKLVEDKSKASKLVDGNEFVVKDFVRALYTTNIHRYTEKMADRKVKGWKKLTKRIYSELRDIVNPRLLQKKGTSGDISDDGEDEGKEDEQEEEEEEGTEEGKRMDVSNNNDLADIGTTELLKGSTEKVFDETETGLEESEQMKRKEIKTTVGKMFPVLPKVFSWSDHVMVSKLVGTPLQHTASGSERTLFVLGKKSFWMESRAREVDHRLIKDNENFQLEKERWSALPSELKKSMRQKINFQYPFSSQQPPFYRQKNPPIESRKADFLDTVNKMNIEKKKFVDDTASIEEADDNIDNSSWKS